MKRSLIIGIFAFICLNIAQAETPVWTLTPLTATNISLSDNETAFIQYQVTNQSRKTHNLMMQPIPGLQQITTIGNCPTLFTLSYKQSCTLTLYVSGSDLRNNIIGGPVVCEKGNPMQCYQPGVANRLNIIKSGAPITYTIGGSVSGLTAPGLVLRNIPFEDLVVPSGATSFQFVRPVLAGGSYDVIVVSQPAGLTCTVGNGFGTNVMQNITSINVTCSSITFTIGGSITGLTDNGLILLNNGDLMHPISPASGDNLFVFTQPVAYGGSYNVTIVAQPASVTCVVSNGSGMNVTANVTSVNINCSPNYYTIGGSITGLTASGLVLSNGADNISPVNGATFFVFPTSVIYGGSYSVTITTQPTGLTCTVSNGSGINVTSNVTSISVICSPVTFTIGGSITGLISSGLVLHNNGNDAISPSSGDPSFVFPTPVAYGGSYSVTVAAQPAGLTCSVSNASGSNVTSNISSVAVTCSAQSYTLGGNVTDLTTSGLVLRNNGSDDLLVSAGATTFQFATQVAFGAGYLVTIATQPTDAYCYVNNGTGTMPAGNVSNVQVTCLNIGDALGGGVIYQISGSTAYVVSLSNVANTQWATGPSMPFPTQSDGYLNTYTILTNPIYTATMACRNFNSGQGWFLPASDQWGVLGSTPVLIALNAKSGTTGFTQFTGGTTYWTSSAYTYNPLWGYAFTREFSSSTVSVGFNYLKTLSLPLRCARGVAL